MDTVLVSKMIEVILLTSIVVLFFALVLYTLVFLSRMLMSSWGEIDSDDDVEYRERVSLNTKDLQAIEKAIAKKQVLNKSK
jgi:hypothetical protein